MPFRLARVFALAAVVLSAPLAAQVQTEVPPVVASAKPVAVERIKIHGTALEGNLEGDAVDRDVLVFLPPGYAKEKRRRYPVVYALHGFFIGAEQWSHEIHVPQTIEGAFALGAREMIVVLPDSKTRAQRFDVLELGDHRRLREFHRAGCRVVCRRALPHARQPREPWTRRSFHGRLRRDPHRHEARRRIRQPVHHESLLSLGAAGRARQP